MTVENILRNGRAVKARPTGPRPLLNDIHHPDVTQVIAPREVEELPVRRRLHDAERPSLPNEIRHRPFAAVLDGQPPDISCRLIGAAKVDMLSVARPPRGAAGTARQQFRLAALG